MLSAPTARLVSQLTFARMKSLLLGVFTTRFHPFRWIQTCCCNCINFPEWAQLWVSVVPEFFSMFYFFVVVQPKESERMCVSVCGKRFRCANSRLEFNQEPVLFGNNLALVKCLRIYINFLRRKAMAGRSFVCMGGQTINSRCVLRSWAAPVCEWGFFSSQN